MAIHNELGIKGEALAKTHLHQKGYEILAQNWTHGKAEVDLIARLGQQLIFVEVKTRTGTGFGMPEDFVNNAKQKQMEKAARAYLDFLGHEGEIRFDIVAILFHQEHQYTINHIEDAFWPY